MTQTIDEIKLAVVQELTAIAGDPTATAEQVKGRLGDVYQRAEQRGDPEQMQMVVEVWGHIEMMINQQTQTVSLAAAAREVVSTLTGQRDEAVEQYADLVEDIETFNYENPIVSEFMEAITEEAHNDLLQSGMYVSECPACDMTGLAEIPVEHTQAEVFHLFISGVMRQDEMIPDEVYKELAQELATFVAGFVKKVDAQIDDMS